MSFIGHTDFNARLEQFAETVSDSRGQFEQHIGKLNPSEKKLLELCANTLKSKEGADDSTLAKFHQLGGEAALAHIERVLTGQTSRSTAKVSFLASLNFKSPEKLSKKLEHAFDQFEARSATKNANATYQASLKIVEDLVKAQESIKAKIPQSSPEESRKLQNQTARLLDLQERVEMRLKELSTYLASPEVNPKEIGKREKRIKDVVAEALPVLEPFKEVVKEKTLDKQIETLKKEIDVLKLAHEKSRDIEVLLAINLQKLGPSYTRERADNDRTRLIAEAKNLFPPNVNYKELGERMKEITALPSIASHIRQGVALHLDHFEKEIQAKEDQLQDLENKKEGQI